MFITSAGYGWGFYESLRDKNTEACFFGNAFTAVSFACLQEEEPSIEIQTIVQPKPIQEARPDWSFGVASTETTSRCRSPEGDSDAAIEILRALKKSLEAK